MIGIDMVYIPRIAEAMARREEKFLEKILSGDDINNCLLYTSPSPRD